MDPVKLNEIEEEDELSYSQEVQWRFSKRKETKVVCENIADSDSDEQEAIHNETTRNIELLDENLNNSEEEQEEQTYNSGFKLQTYPSKW